MKRETSRAHTGDTIADKRGKGPSIKSISHWPRALAIQSLRDMNMKPAIKSLRNMENKEVGERCEHTASDKMADCNTIAERIISDTIAGHGHDHGHAMTDVSRELCEGDSFFP